MVDGKYYKDLHLAARYREDTVIFVRSQLGLSDPDRLFTTGNAVIDSFAVIGEVLRSSCSIGESLLVFQKFSIP